MRVMSSRCSEGLKLWIRSTTEVRVCLAGIFLFCRRTSTSLCSPNSSPEASKDSVTHRRWIVEGPGRGADLGKDSVVEEARFGVFGESVIRWLVVANRCLRAAESLKD